MKYLFWIIPAALVWVVAVAIVNGWAVSILWGWFLVPLGLPQISIPHAMGLVVLITMLFYHRNNNNNDDENKYKVVGEIIGFTARPFFALLFGFIIKQFM